MEKIKCPMSQFFPLEVDLILRRLHCHWMPTGSNKKNVLKMENLVEYRRPVIHNGQHRESSSYYHAVANFD